MASNFLSTDNSMIGRRFEGGPGFFPGFRRGFRIPCLICSGYSPVHATLFSSLATPSCISGGPYFTNSASRLSSPTLFLFFKLSAAFFISKPVKGVFISHGGIVGSNSFVSIVNIFWKCFAIKVICSFSEPATLPSSPCTMRGFFGFLLLRVLIV